MNKDMRGITYGDTNVNNPVGKCLDNVSYNIAGHITNYVSFTPAMPYPRTEIVPALDRNNNYITIAGGEIKDAPINISNGSSGTNLGHYPVYLPKGGENACLDEMTVTVYMFPQFYPYLPIVPYTHEEQIHFNGSTSSKPNCTSMDPCYGNTHSFDGGCTSVPFIIGSTLTWNLARTCANTLGPIWSKTPQTFLLGCCFLVKGASGNGIPAYDGDVCTASAYTLSYGDNIREYLGARTYVHNHITDGSVTFTDIPTILSGSKTFYGKDARFTRGEYSSIDVSKSLNIFYLRNGMNIDMLNQFWKNRPRISRKASPDDDGYGPIYFVSGGVNGEELTFHVQRGLGKQPNKVGFEKFDVSVCNVICYHVTQIYICFRSEYVRRVCVW